LCETPSKRVVAVVIVAIAVLILAIIVAVVLPMLDKTALPSGSA
jgi:type II secretory pathway component PulF